MSELQASVDRLLAEKLQLEQRVDELTKELGQLRDQVGWGVGGLGGGTPAHLDLVQHVVTLPLSPHLSARPGGRRERGPAEEHEQAEQEHEQNQAR